MFITNKGFFFLLVLCLFIYSCDSDKTEKYVEEKITPLTNHWEVAIPNQEIPEGLTSLSAASCGTCHQEHYQEWQLSTHAHAWTDLQFQAELKKESSPFMCINCHIPLQNQQEYIVTGLINGDIYKPIKEKNPKFDKILQQEGINCASCHVRDGAIIGPTGTEKAPHKTVKGVSHLSEQLCISCHNANAVITPTLACTFQTGDEWKAGPYYGKKNCIDCHMPELNRAIVSGYDKRKSRRHFFMGSGIPKDTSYTPKILNGVAFYPQKVKANFKINETLNYQFKVKNEHAGHRVPTGDPERFFSIELNLLDATGRVIATQKDRVGETWQWHPEAKKISDNNINPGEERSFDFSTELKTKGEYKLTLKVTKNRMTKETAKYNKLGSDYPLYIIVFEEEYEFLVD